MNKISLTFFTVIIGVLLAVVFFQMEKPKFEIENKFIVVPQTSIISNDMNNVMNNIVSLISEQEKNNLIDSTQVKVERINNSSMFKITVLAKNEEKVKELNDKINYKMLDEVTQYYKLNSDLKINLIKKSEVTENSLNKILPIFFWILIGILVSILIIMFVEIITPKNKKNKKVVIDFSQSKNIKDKENYSRNIDSENEVYDLKTSLSQRKPSDNNREINKNYEFLSSSQKNSKNTNYKESLAEIVSNSNEDTTIEKNQVNFVDRSVNLENTENNYQNNDSFVPNNLPIVSEEIENTNIPENSDEPTDEELKARLNALLSGKL